MDTPDIGKAHARLTGKVIDLPGVTGVAVGTRRGRPCLKVYVDRAKGRSPQIPKTVLGLDVIVEETGRLERH